MKSFFNLSLTLIFLFVSVALSGQDADISFDFETDGDTEGWTKSGGNLFQVSGGTLQHSELANFSGIRTGQGLNIAEAVYTRIVIVMKNPTDFPTFQVINHDSGDNNFGNGEKTDFTVSTGDAEFHQYTVDIPVNAINGGVIDQIGIRAKGNPSDETVEYESITIKSNNTNLEWNFNADGDAQGWVPTRSTLSISQGALTMDFVSETQPPKITISNLAYDAANFPQIELVLKNTTAVENIGGANDAQCMRVVTNSTTEGTQFITFDHSGSDTEFQTYTIDLSGFAKYSGTIDYIEFHGVRDGNPGSIEIDNIRLISALTSYTLTTGTTGFGAVDLTTGDYPEGEYTITATPTFGNEFVNWTDGGGSEVSTDASYTFTLDAALSLTANFQPTTATTIGWYFDEDEEGWATVGGAAVSAIQADGVLTFSIDASAGNPRIEVTNLAVNATDFPYARLTIKNSTAVSADGLAAGVGMRFRSDNSEAALGLFEFAHSSSDENFKTYIIDLTSDGDYAGIIEKFEFQGIRDGATIGTIEIDKIELIATPATYTLTSQTAGFGEISLPTGDYAEGFTIVSATAHVGNEFTGWSGDVETTQNPLELNLADNTSLTANFSQISGEEIVWNFDADEDTEGWSPLNANLTVAGGILTMDITGNTPKLLRTDVGLNPDDYAAMEIRLKNNTPVGPIDETNTNMRIGYDPFTEIDDQGDKFYNIEGTANDGDFVTYMIPIGDQANYASADHIEGLQFVGPRQQGVGTVEIDYIKFIPKQEQGITFSVLEAAIFGDADITLPELSDANLPIDYSSDNEEVATVSGNILTVVGAGTANITASQNGDSYYYPAESVVQGFSVSQGSQTITFDQPSPVSFGDPSFDLVGSSDFEGLEVDFVTEDTDVVTIVGGTVTIVGAGEASITAIQEGNSNVSAADPVIRTLIVNKANPVISITPIEDKWTTQTPVSVVAESTSAEASLEYSVSGPASNTGSEVTLTGSTGEVTITVSQTESANYNAAEESASFEVVSCDDVTVGQTSENVSCFGEADGSIDLTVSGGIGSYSISWSNSADTEDLTNLLPGTYTAIVSFGEFCSKEVEVTITSPDEIVVTGTTTESNGADGAIDVTVTGGSGSFSFEWDNSAISEDLTNLPPGDYTVVITDDESGCEVTETFTVDSGITLSAEDLETVIRAYPNPTTDFITIGSNADWIGSRVVLMDMSGKVVSSDILVTENQEFALSHLSKGRYFLQIKGDAKSEVISILKN